MTEINIVAGETRVERTAAQAKTAAMKAPTSPRAQGPKGPRFYFGIQRGRDSRHARRYAYEAPSERPMGPWWRKSAHSHDADRTGAPCVMFPVAPLQASEYVALSDRRNSRGDSYLVQPTLSQNPREKSLSFNAVSLTNGYFTRIARRISRPIPFPRLVLATSRARMSS